MTCVDSLISAGRDVWAIACNYREDTSTVSSGSRAYLLNCSGGSGYVDVKVRARSRGGRWITKWERTRRLTDFRATSVPTGHPLRGRTDVELFPTKAAAEERAAELMAVARREATALTMAYRITARL